MNKETTIPTNHGDLTSGQIIDSLTYSAYRSNREEGCSFESLKKWYSKADLYEQKYQSEKQTQ